ncbi:MAG: hypothetical protein ACOYN4_01780 [Bacteroidales bacterium]
MRTTILLLLTFVVILFTFFTQACSSFLGSDRPKSPEELRMDLKLQEQFDPTLYLTVSESTMKHNLTRKAGLFRDAEYDGWIIEGDIKNTASVAKFKDVVLTISLFSQTQTVIEEKDYVIYEFYSPNETKHFSFKIYPPEATNKFNVSVKSATAVE